MLGLIAGFTLLSCVISLPAAGYQNWPAKLALTWHLQFASPGECEMAAEKVQDERLAKRLQRIRQAATTMAKELKEHQCRLDAMTREREASNLTEAEKVSAPKLDLRCRWLG